MKYLLTILIMSMLVTLPCLADDTQNIGIEANVGTISPTFNIGVTPVNASTDAWGTTDNTPPYNIDFGTLSADPVNNILVSDTYYAVGVGVVANVPWNITYSATTISGPGGDLNDNVNVTFVATDGSTDTELDKVAYSSALGGVSYTDASFGSGEWLRIYYGIATGATDDAPGAEPIPVDTPTGSYTGTVTLSVTAR